MKAKTSPLTAWYDVGASEPTCFIPHPYFPNLSIFVAVLNEISQLAFRGEQFLPKHSIPTGLRSIFAITPWEKNTGMLHLLIYKFLVLGTLHYLHYLYMTLHVCFLVSWLVD